MTIGNPYGFLGAQFFRKTSSGIALGTLNPDSLSGGSLDGTTTHAHLIQGTTGGTLPALTYDYAEFKDNQRYQGKVNMGLSTVDDLVINTNAIDSTLMQMFVGSSQDDTTTIDGVTIFALDTKSVDFHDLGLIMVQRFHDRSSATRGNTYYLTTIFPSVDGAVELGELSQDGGVNTYQATIRCSVRYGGKFPGGNAFSSTQGWQNNEELFYMMKSNLGGFALTSFVGDGLTTTYTTKYVPASTDVASGNTTHLFTENAVVTAPTSITTGGVVTLSSAPAASEIATALYQTSFDEVA